MFEIVVESLIRNGLNSKSLLIARAFEAVCGIGESWIGFTDSVQGWYVCIESVGQNTWKNGMVLRSVHQLEIRKSGDAKQSECNWGRLVRGPKLALVAAAAILEGVAARALKGLSLSCPQNSVQLGMFLGNCLQVVAERQVWGSAPNQQVSKASFGSERLPNRVPPGGQNCFTLRLQALLRLHATKSIDITPLNLWIWFRLVHFNTGKRSSHH